MYLSSCIILGFYFQTFKANALNILKTTTTPNGFNGPAMGWNSFGLQATSPLVPGWDSLQQSKVLEQCLVLASNTALKNAGYKYCSLDSGWSADAADPDARVLFNSDGFPDFNTTFTETLHDNGLLLGVYVVPGIIQPDVDKTIFGTNIKVRDALLVRDGNFVDAGNFRFVFDFEKEGAQEWHDGVVALWAEWGINMIKLDFVTPGSCNTNDPFPICVLPGFPIDSSATVKAYHKAIQNSGRDIRLDISWKLERNDTYYDVWRTNAESMRTDQDINEGSGSSVFTKWQTVQRAIENHRQYIILQIPKNEPISIYPDMDNLFVANPASLSGISDDERTTVMSHWIGAAANLVIGSDLTDLDVHGIDLLSNAKAMEIAAFTREYPMQPRNPGSGGTEAKQLQAWIAGPSDSGEAVTILANYGPDLGQGGFGTNIEGEQTVSITVEDLGLEGSFLVSDVWLGTDAETIGVGQPLSRILGEGQSKLFKLTPRQRGLHI